MDFILVIYLLYANYQHLNCNHVRQRRLRIYRKRRNQNSKRKDCVGRSDKHAPGEYRRRR